MDTDQRTWTLDSQKRMSQDIRSLPGQQHSDDVLRSQGYEVEHTPAGQPINSRSISAPDQTGHSLGQNLDESPYLEPFLHELHDEEQQHPLQDNPRPNVLPPRHSHSLQLMDKMDRKLKKKRRNKQRKHQRNGQFNDLWVRIEER
ncbi:metalloprotease TIKI1-like [Salvelinus sp. IW2-2015]|uniref:metalloprotease TIKI1-like n=1 Tax=Salvelinus sp. IW2-2015 TaxID=2691554 RepID=UPI0038D51100